MREQDAIVWRGDAVINNHGASQGSGGSDHVVVAAADVLTRTHQDHLFVCQHFVLDQGRAPYIRGRVLTCA